MTDESRPIVEGFSNPIRSAGASAAGFRDDCIWGGGAMAVGVALFILSIIIGRKPGEDKAIYFGLAALLVAFAFSGFFWLDFWFLKARRTWLYPEGLVVRLRGKLLTCRWDEVEEISFWSHIADVALRKSNGEQIDFNYHSVDRAYDFARVVKEKVVATMAPRIATELKSGETVNFGRVEADDAGLTIHYRAYPSPKEVSFYRGPWPRADRPKNHAQSQEQDAVHVAWKDIVDLQEAENCDLVLITKAGSIPICGWPGDVPNSIVIPALAKLMN